MPLEHPYEPVDLQKVQQAFPADALDYMPAMEDIPEPWNDLRHNRSWPCELTSDIIFRGLDDIQLIPHDKSWGQEDVNRAFTHVVTIARSFAPKHEHKEASMRFLLDRWFSHARWKPKSSGEWSGDWPEELDNTTIDNFGRKWNLPSEELCSTCGQPDNCGDCNHEALSNDEAKALGAEIPTEGRTQGS